MARIAINGFGRIGRAVFKASWGRKDLQIVAINDLTDAKTLAYLLKHDTMYGTWDVDVSAGKDFIKVNGKKIKILSQHNPEKLPWEKIKVDVVIESTGVFRTEESASAHLKAGARRVVISSPAKGGNVPTYVVGANTLKLKKDLSGIINGASCTTNCVAPVMAILDEEFGVKKAMLTTIHSYTATQNIVDGPHKDLRRARAAGMNMIPTTTGAAEATAETLPKLDGKFDGLAIRIPLALVSLSDVTVLLKKNVKVETVNNAFKKASRSKRWKGILAVSEIPLVSSDFIADSHSAIVDLQMTRVVDGDLIKIVAWYDNEWGYANRLLELTILASKGLLRRK